MAEVLQTFDTFFSQDTDYTKDPKHLLELVSEHTHENQPGYLFKHLATNRPIFARKDQLLNGNVETNSQYHFMGFLDNSSVAVLEKRTL